jgi:hypothetical protein
MSIADAIKQVNVWGSVNWTKRVVSAVGIGAPSPNMPIAAARPNALRAAQMVALRNALEIVKGIPVSSNTVVENRIISNDIITTKIDGFLRGFEQQGKPKYMSDGTVELTIDIPIDNELAELLLPETITDTPAIKKTIRDTRKKPAFSGIIVDCTGLELVPSMVPSIFDEEGREVYGPSYISRTSVIKSGAAVYTTSVDIAKQYIDRIGTTPLLIKAISLADKSSNDVLISKKEGKDIREHTANYSVLEQCRVVFVIDK